MRFALLAAAGVALVPVAVAVDALDQTAMMDPGLPAPEYHVEPVVTAVVPVPQETLRDTTSSSLRFASADAPTVVTSPVRGTMAQVADTLPATGIHGLPLAVGLEGCDLARFYRIQFGLPERFDGIIWRESRCQPDASNSCCSGLAQIHKLWVPQLADCGVYVRSDLYDPQRNMCAAAYVYEVQGINAWTTA